MNDTVVIIGHHADGQGEFDWKRQDCDVWLFNEAASMGAADMPWCSAVFQMHLPAIFRNPTNRNDKEHYRWLRENNAIPVIMQEAYPDIPQAVEYPLGEIVDKYLGKFIRPGNEVWDDQGGYFTCSLAYMLAYALYKGYKRIECYGIGLARGTEYEYQRPGAFFWYGLCLGAGMTVDIHGHMFDAPLYGYNGDIYIPLEKFTERLEVLRPQLRALETLFQEQKINFTGGIRAYTDRQITKLEMDRKISSYSQAMIDVAAHKAFIEENEKYVSKALAMMRADDLDDFRFSRSEFEDRRHDLRKQFYNLHEERSVQRKVVETEYLSIDKASGYKNRCRAADSFVKSFNDDATLLVQLAALDAKSLENIRYMNILDEQYRAAGGQSAVDVLKEAA